MEVHDPPNHTRYCELFCPSDAARIEFLSFSPATCLHKLNFRVADDPLTAAAFLQSQGQNQQESAAVRMRGCQTTARECSNLRVFG